MTDKYNHLTPYEFMRHCVHAETLGLERKFTWGRVFRRYLKRQHIRYQIKWRYANYLHVKGGKWSKKIAHWLNERISEQHNVEIGLGAVIGPGLRIAHHNGIVLTHIVRAGDNLTIRQNTTIGMKTHCDGLIVIGDNVAIGAHCCIIADNLSIGNNVTIGAHTFLNKDLEDGVTCFTKHEYTLIHSPNPPAHLVTEDAT
ncbi:serine acetyltransferase [Candidatus Pantoea formicae]|uniref:serine acetyltransferase n=1 Tax=Candidatus Pantoea formicae TaxID=2608355 RepID=UPI003ED99B1C